jgi:hypothetical protein
LQVGGDLSALNRIFLHYTGTAPTPAQMITFADAVSSAWAAQLQALHGTNINQLPIQCEDLSSATGAVGVGTTSHTGTRAGVVIPAATALMIQFFIARRYRGGKPKVFLPAGTQPDLGSNQSWASAFVTAAASDWGTFITQLTTSGWTGAGTITHVNVSYYSGFTVVTNPITHRARNVPTPRGAPVVDPVISYGVEVGLASQRRRNQV